MQNGGPGVADGISRLSVSSGGGQHGDLPNGNAIVPVGEVRTALPEPNLEGIKQVETHTRALGVIQPPPDLKAIVDKTASYVAKNDDAALGYVQAVLMGNGASFEGKIRGSNADNPRFNFLKPGDVYHAYYKHAVARELRALAGDTSSTAVQQAEQAADLAKQAAPAPVAPSTLAKPLTPPEPDQFSVRTPEGLTGEHVDIMKLTAQCVARNGHNFLAGLTQREQGNSAFLFLKPTHSLHGFFQELIVAYRNTLMPDQKLMAKLRKDASDRQAVLERCLNRLEWEKNKEAQDRAASDKATAERIAMQSIDWHDFTVVETIDFFDDEDDDLPAPMTQKDVVLLNRANAFRDEAGEEQPASAQEKGPEDVEMDDEEKAMIDEGNAAPELEAAAQTAQQAQVRVEVDNDDEPMRIVKDYQRPAARPNQQSTAGLAVSPITGELVPLAEMAEHMRISLMDPQWKTQREAMLSKIRETTQASDDEISKNLVDLAGHRPDVFGSNDEEVGAMVKASMDEKRTTGNDRAIAWDGQTTGGTALHNQLNAIEENRVESNKRKEPERTALPTPILGPSPATFQPGSLPPPPAKGDNLPAPPQVRPSASALPGPPPSASSQPSSRPPPSQLPPPVLTPPVLPPPQIRPPPPQPAPVQAPAPPLGLGEEPDTKRRRVEFVLQSESDFLQQYPHGSKVRIACPDEPDNENLSGQILEVEVQSLATSIGDLKQRLADVVGLPANKQLLSREHIKNLKDIDTLAYYNISPDVELQLSVRRRGGR